MANPQGRAQSSDRSCLQLAALVLALPLALVLALALVLPLALAQRMDQTLQSCRAAAVGWGRALERLASQVQRARKDLQMPDCCPAAGASAAVEQAGRRRALGELASKAQEAQTDLGKLQSCPAAAAELLVPAMAAPAAGRTSQTHLMRLRLHAPIRVSSTVETALYYVWSVRELWQCSPSQAVGAKYQQAVLTLDSSCEAKVRWSRRLVSRGPNALVTSCRQVAHPPWSPEMANSGCPWTGRRQSPPR